MLTAMAALLTTTCCAPGAAARWPPAGTCCRAGWSSWTPPGRRTGQWRWATSWATARTVLIGATLPGDELTSSSTSTTTWARWSRTPSSFPTSVRAMLEQLAGDGRRPGRHVHRTLDPADARARMTEAIELTSITFPPIETDAWPASGRWSSGCCGCCPRAGSGYVRPEWSETDRRALAERFLASPFGRGASRRPRSRDYVNKLRVVRVDDGPGDPLRWSPVAVEILLLDWFPARSSTSRPRWPRCPTCCAPSSGSAPPSAASGRR